MLNKNTVQKIVRFIFLLLTFLLGSLGAVGAQIPGDVDGSGSVDIVDALQIARYSVGFDVPGFDETAADADADGNITIVDALIVAQYYVGLILHIPPSASPGPKPTPGAKADNPFAGVSWYVNSLWAEKAIAGGGEAIAGYNTGIWIDRIAEINGGIGVRGHLDNAVSQGAGLIMFIIYNLPNRECHYDTPSSELQISEDGGDRYKTEFIDPLAALFSGAAYKDLRIVCILEPMSLPNLVTNLDLTHCAEANGAGGYVECIQYALNKFAAIPNVYNYMDVAQSGWLGWTDNFEGMLDLYTNTIGATEYGFNSISGFITNTANYSPLSEPYLPWDPNYIMNGVPIRAADFYEWNSYFDELSYAGAVYNAMVDFGFSAEIGMLIDTSRNGWGGPDRPTAQSTSTDLNTFVSESRIDRRYHRGSWCNQRGGIGERPVANPEPHFDAYVWAKPPGESDGTGIKGSIDPNDPAKVYDSFCDPTPRHWEDPYNGSMDNAPHREYWFQEQFEILLKNAWPPL